jgi:hypothetical protein
MSPGWKAGGGVSAGGLSSASASDLTTTIPASMTGTACGHLPGLRPVVVRVFIRA